MNGYLLDTNVISEYSRVRLPDARGITLAIIDGLMAATAKHHDLTVVTRNVRDFSVWGLSVVNPWEET